MSISTTRIADLPDSGVTMSIQGADNGFGGGPGAGMGAGMYAPINVHPNPYGPGTGSAAPDPGAVPYPAQGAPAGARREGVREEAPARQEHRLPARDIPNSQDEYLHDDEARPNYIPRKKRTSDYIREFEEKEAGLVASHERGARRRALAESVMDRVQMAVVAALLFCVFQLAAADRVMATYLSLLGTHGGDGAITATGRAIKCVAFGATIFALGEALRAATEA